MESSLVGQRISKARIKLGMSTQELAEKIGKSQATVSRIENGKQGVTLPLLLTLSRVLQTNLTALIDHDHVGGNEIQKYGFVLQTILSVSRERAHLTLDLVAAETAIRPERLRAIEEGALQPVEAELEKLCVLYNLDYEPIFQIFFAEQHCPLLIAHLGKINYVLGECLDLLRASRQIADKSRLTGLTQRIENCLTDFSCERQGDYFSIGHISDQLMKALQDPEFHARAEELARQWRQPASERPARSAETDSDCVSEGDPLFLHSEARLLDSPRPADRLNAKAVYYTQRPDSPTES